MTGLRNILHDQMDRTDRTAAHESCRFPGHDARLTSHTRRLRAAPCECGSGAAYANCCMDCDWQRTEPGVQYMMPPEAIQDLARRRAVEDDFRVTAFRTFYKSFRQEHDPALRFVRALVASAKPVDDHQQILAWHRRFRRRRRSQEAQP